jgi:hypothetical protein
MMLSTRFLRQVGEPTCATADEAFIAVLKLMQTPDWTERVRAAGFDNPPTRAADKLNKAQSDAHSPTNNVRFWTTADDAGPHPNRHQ